MPRAKNPNKEKDTDSPATDKKPAAKKKKSSAPRLPISHELKTEVKHFTEKWAGVKSFSVRKNDRDFRVNDFIWFSEIKGKSQTGRRIRAKITYILDDFDGLAKGYVGIALKVLTKLKLNREKK